MKTFQKQFLIFIVFLFYSKLSLGLNSSNSDWIAVDSSGVFFINQKIFPRDRHLRKALEIQNFPSPSVDGVYSMELLTEYDCKKATFRLLSHRAFSGSTLKGKMVYDWQDFDPRAFVGIPYRTPANKIFKLICGYERITSLR